MESRFSSDSGSAVRNALRRWEEKGLLSPELAATLRREADEWSRSSGRRFGQVAVAVTGGLLLLIAVGVFLARAWPDLPAGARTVVIAFLALIVHGTGSFLLGRRPASVLARVFQISGLAVLLLAFLHSQEVWPDGSVAALVVGLSALAVPFGVIPGALRTGPAPGAVTAALGYGFLAVFLDRALGLGEDSLIWILDGVAVLSILFLLLRLGRDRGDEAGGWEVAALLMSLYAGLVLTFLTGVVVLDLESGAVWPLDAWLALIVAATLWAIHRAPSRLRRPWYPDNLAWTMILAIPLGFWTFADALDAPPFVTSLAVGILGALGLAYALRWNVGRLVVTSCLALVAAAWFLGVSVGNAAGAVGALAFTAVLLFWVSSRVGAEAAST